MPKRKEPEMTPAEQYKRFKKAAKDAGVTEDEKAFEGVFKKVAKAPPSSQDDKAKPKKRLVK
jgi:hypothetical protein